MNSSATSLLRRHHLRITHPREAILAMFFDHHSALTQSEVEAALAVTIDRVTVYRTLKTFLEAGLLHRVLDDTGTPRYALCSTACSTETHRHDHVHFKCQDCGRTRCVEEVDVPPVRLPAGYQPHEVNLLVHGVCPDCSPGR